MRKCLDENSTINAIRLSLRHPQGKRIVWVLVEGETDQKLYSKLIDGNDVKVTMVPGGVGSLRKAVATLVEESDQLVGIRDADFLHLDNKQESIRCLFLTDVHDAEMMILMCDAVFHCVVAEYLPDRLNDFVQLRDELLSSLTFLGGIRWINDNENLDLNFKAGLTSFYNSVDLTLDKSKCLQKIEQCSPNKKRIPSETEIDDKIVGVSDRYNLCNGHDFESAFAIYITEKNRISDQKDKGGINSSDIGKALRVAYRKEDFVCTKLYKYLRDWEIETNYMLFATSPA
jgi:hypothetical protein